MTNPTPDSIPYSSITFDGRYRPDEDYGDLSGLKASLSSLGTIHPLTLSRNSDGSYKLIAGGRRHRALGQLGCTTLYHGSVLDPLKPGFLFSDEVPDDVAKEAELDENLHRLSMPWHANVLLAADVHAAKQRQHVKWGLEATAALLGKGFGKSNLGYMIKVAKLLREGDAEIRACSDFKATLEVLAKRQEVLCLQEVQRRAKANGIIVIENGPPVSLPMPEVPTDSVLSAFNELGPKKTFTTPSVDPLKAATDQIVPASLDPNAVVPLSKMFLHGDSLRTIMPAYPPASFHHIVTDIPYGIDMDNLTEHGLADVAAQHDVQSNVDQMQLFLEQAFRLVKPSGFCVFFYDLDHHEKLQTWAKEVGWRIQRWPLTWVKTHPCQNNAAGFNWAKTTEVAMVLRRDESSVLRKVMTQSHWIGDGSAERKLYNNKFAKPQALWRELIFDAIAYPGQSVYDPFWGEGSASRAAANSGLLPYGSEIEEHHFLRGIENMKGVYSAIHNSNVIFQ